MAEFEVISEFIDAMSGVRKISGDTIEATGDRADKLRQKGLIGKPARKQKKETAEIDQGGEQRDYPISTGGGWYELSNGESVRGKKKAIKVQKELESSG
ncbi:hypothetical protein MWH25_01395 [Natroniella acetigena]|uniref:hypothetical protein n=1 Tax=Natroniella acetigena TaxID=52004 RepID=UPI00200A1E85|nr:hypothetical protein [Natroniella acetigena]MCK8826402.1 hypothetical protein [Natroniella acetigena]